METEPTAIGEVSLYEAYAMESFYAGGGSGCRCD